MAGVGGCHLGHANTQGPRPVPVVRDFLIHGDAELQGEERHNKA